MYANPCYGYCETRLTIKPNYLLPRSKKSNYNVAIIFYEVILGCKSFRRIRSVGLSEIVAGKLKRNIFYTGDGTKVSKDGAFKLGQNECTENK